MTETERPAPSGRTYPATVTLVRRSRRYADGPPPSGFDQTIEDWLLTTALDESELLHLFEDFVWRLIDDGHPLDRASLHVGTLHPQLYGFGCNWERADRLCDEIKVPQAALASDAYRRNPLFRVIEHGETVRVRAGDAQAAARYPLIADLEAAGFSDYVAMPLRAGGRYHNAMTIATRQPGGFSDTLYTRFARAARIFALHVERHIAEQLAANVVTTYLGREAGARVLDGSIHRGDGLPIDAVIWVSDLRGFTDLTDRMAPETVLRLLNAYFGAIVAAISDAGGEVLKFMGDGLLAAFAYARFDSPQDAARAALAATRSALDAVAELHLGGGEGNGEGEGDGEGKGDDTLPPLRSGIALHEGRVFFGNIGGAERLDFTVIGRAVNTASRIERLTKTLNRPVLISEAVAALVDEPMETMGAHPLRGVGAPVALYAPEVSRPRNA
ncbi:adenylate/guanylate cyclase domain-containing protein [Stappia sp.]|uniref:adenylate/guanylate cyclase domain-containing protein n=1 Tax=Stappia sp. TaxID=1870903 RepID=UPI0032D9A75F